MDVLVDEAIYNGDRETFVKKTVFTGDNMRENPDPFLLAKSLVMTGSGRALVCAVGQFCCYNDFEMKKDEEKELAQEVLTPLK